MMRGPRRVARGAMLTFDDYRIGMEQFGTAVPMQPRLVTARVIVRVGGQRPVHRIRWKRTEGDLAVRRQGLAGRCKATRL